MSTPAPKKFEIRKILIPFDFSETAKLALEHGVFMAKLLKAEMTLLHVVESVGFTSIFSSVDKKVEEESNRQLQEVANDIHRHHGITVKYKTESGRIYKKIISFAKEYGADIMVMGTHGASGYKKMRLGSNTVHVVEEASCPVLSVQNHAKKIGFKHIILPIDNTPASRQKVKHATAVASHYNSHMHIVGLIDFGSEDLKRKFKIKLEQVEEFLDTHNVGYETRIIEGDNLAKMTMQAGEEIDADLIVIMTEQDPSITGLLLGTYASQVVNHSKIPVLSIHPQATDPERVTVGY